MSKEITVDFLKEILSAESFAVVWEQCALSSQEAERKRVLYFPLVTVTLPEGLSHLQ